MLFWLELASHKFKGQILKLRRQQSSLVNTNAPQLKYQIMYIYYNWQLKQNKKRVRNAPTQTQTNGNTFTITIKHHYPQYRHYQQL